MRWTKEKITDIKHSSGIGYSSSRRNFLKLAGSIAGAGALVTACHPRSGPTDIYLGDNDTALLNYLYILQQVEAAFYTQAVATYYLNISTSEYDLLIDLRDQEIAHSEFLQSLVYPNAIPNIVIDFNAVTFADRTSVISNAIVIEDLVVSAMNGAANLFSNTSYTYAVAKMVSVEARHSAYMHDLLSYNSFANSAIINSSGLDQAITPQMGLSSVQQYVQTRFDASKLPS